MGDREAWSEWYNRAMSSRPLKIFFSGIGGSGVSALASFMADKGNTVAGSDRAFERNPNHPVCRALSARGIQIVPQDGSGLDASFDLVVSSTAVEPDQPEMIKARSLGIPVKTRPDYLAELSQTFNTIAVAGTSGKSTTSGMLAFLMYELGLEPNFVGGGRVPQFKTEGAPGNARAGRSDTLVIEACESDGTIVNYKPKDTIILNLELDHHSIEETAEMFRVLIQNTSGHLILNADDPNLSPFITERTTTFSLDKPSKYRAHSVDYSHFSTTFYLNDVCFTLPIPGKYNLSNALSCIALLAEYGIPLQKIVKPLQEFHGIERRFDICLNDGTRLVIDDYAHNPHKISSLMETVQKIKERICYIFQPHGFAPTRMMKHEYIEAFASHLRDSDHLILLPIFYAGGTVQKDISSEDLAEGVRERGKSAEVLQNRSDLFARIAEWDTYIVFGARDESLADYTKAIAEQLLHTTRRSS